MTHGLDDPTVTFQHFCVSCGGALVAEGSFCPTCGRSVSQADDTQWGDERQQEGIVVPEQYDPNLEESWFTAFTDESWSAPPEQPAVEPGPGDHPSTPGRPRRRRSGLVAALAVVLLVSAGGTYGYGYLRDKPVQGTFQTSQAAYGVMVAALAGADDLDAVQAAGERAGDTLQTLQTSIRRLEAREGDVSKGMDRLLSSQAAVAEAGADLSGLSEKNLAEWGTLHDALSASLLAVNQAAWAFAVENPERASDVPDSTRILANLETVVGGAVAMSVSESLAEAIDTLATARSTADLRRLAASAARGLPATRAAMVGIAAGSPEAQQLQAVVDVYSDLTRLAVIDPEHLAAWDSARAALAGSLARLDSDTNLPRAGRYALRRVDTTIGQAEDRVTRWKAAYRAAAKDQSADRAALDVYRSGMEAQLSDYAIVQQELSQWVGRVKDPGVKVTYEEARAQLAHVHSSIEMVRAVINDLDVPADVREAHGVLVDVLGDEVTALRTAYDPTKTSDACRPDACAYDDSPKWRGLSAALPRIAGAFEASESRWEAAVKQAASDIADRKLPKMPVV